MEGKLIDLIYQLKSKCASNDTEFISELNISQAEYNLFLGICHCEHLNSKDIAKETGLSTSRISRILDKAVKNGYLKRSIDPDDRRNIKLEITQKGEKIKKSIQDYRLGCEKMLQNYLSDDEIKLVKESFSKVLTVFSNGKSPR